MFPKFPAVQELQKYTNTLFGSCSRQESCTQCLVCSTAFGESLRWEVLETGYAGINMQHINVVYAYEVKTCGDNEIENIPEEG